MANTAFQNVDDEVLAAVEARKAVLEAYRHARLIPEGEPGFVAGAVPEQFGTWVEVTQAEFDALTPREGVLYAIVG
jgi:hypothetical protein